jgi:hypothetical protein
MATAKVNGLREIVKPAAAVAAAASFAVNGEFENLLISQGFRLSNGLYMIEECPLHTHEVDLETMSEKGSPVYYASLMIKGQKDPFTNMPGYNHTPGELARIRQYLTQLMHPKKKEDDFS